MGRGGGAEAAGLTVDILLGDILRPYERRQASDVSLEHALVHREVQPGSDDGVSVVVIDHLRRRRRWRGGVAVGVHLLLLLLLLARRGPDQPVVAEDLTRPALVRLGHREGPGGSLLVRLQQVLVLPGSVVPPQGAYLLSGHFLESWREQGSRGGDAGAVDDPPGELMRFASWESPHKHRERRNMKTLCPPLDAHTRPFLHSK